MAQILARCARAQQRPRPPALPPLRRGAGARQRNRALRGRSLLRHCPPGLPQPPAGRRRARQRGHGGDGHRSFGIPRRRTLRSAGRGAAERVRTRRRRRCGRLRGRSRRGHGLVPGAGPGAAGGSSRAGAGPLQARAAPGRASPSAYRRGGLRRLASAAAARWRGRAGAQRVRAPQRAGARARAAARGALVWRRLRGLISASWSRRSGCWAWTSASPNASPRSSTPTSTGSPSTGSTGRWSSTTPGVRDLVGMGPSALHTDAEALEEAIAALAEPVRVTGSVSVSVYRRRD